jgi:hypothetical protein
MEPVFKTDMKELVKKTSIFGSKYIDPELKGNKKVGTGSQR